MRVVARTVPGIVFAVAAALFSIDLLAGCSDQSPSAVDSRNGLDSGRANSPTDSGQAMSESGAATAPEKDVSTNDLDVLDGIGSDAAIDDADADRSAMPYECADAVGEVPALGLELIAQGFTNPVGLEASRKDTTRLYVIEKAGKIRLIKNGVLVDKPFLDITNIVWAESEAGLLGVAFHPDYEKNGRFWAYFVYKDVYGSALAEFHRSASDPDVADPQPVGNMPIFTAKPSYVHQGGGLEFGGDGMLFLALGDRGLGLQSPAPDLGSHLGKILRFDVTTYPYSIPAGNVPKALAEIWDYGLRNPWRISFDLCSGDFFIADVGEIAHEEIDIEPPGQGHHNYGWPTTEGASCFLQTTCDTTGLTFPSLDIGHDVMNVVIGGYVYRGSSIPGLRSRYIYGDISGHLYWLSHSSGVVTNHERLVAPLLTGELVSFGQDAAGELYTVEMMAGRVSRLRPAQPVDASLDASVE
jgi:glucose/arabinose dehydrogenase